MGREENRVPNFKAHFANDEAYQGQSLGSVAERAGAVPSARRAGGDTERCGALGPGGPAGAASPCQSPFVCRVALYTEPLCRQCVNCWERRK